MGNATDCMPLVDRKPDQLSLTACQLEAKTPFCWPPNGTRICMPSTHVYFYWPKGYYDPSSEVDLTYDPGSSYFDWRYNSGIGFEDFISNSMFNLIATAIPGAPWYEKSLKMYMRERRFGDAVVNKTNLEIHEGPTIILVKTPPTTTSTTMRTTSRYTYATATGRSSSSSYGDRDGKQAMSPGAIAGTVIGIVIAFILLLAVCCRQMRETSSSEQERIHAALQADQQKRINQQAMELMQQQNVQRQVDDVEEPVVTSEERPPAYGEAPPRYTP